MMHLVTSFDPDFTAANRRPMVMYRNLLTEGTVASASLPAAAPRANALTESTFDFWDADATPDTLRATFGSPVAADGAFFAAHSIGSSGGSLTAQYYDGSAWQDILTVTPPTDEPFGILWPTISASGWGISVTGMPQIGVAFIGPRLVIPTSIAPGYSPIWAARRVTKLPGTSVRGQWFGQRIQRRGGTLSPTFNPLSLDFALNDMADFRDRFIDGHAFVWASAPSIFPDDAAYCWAAEENGFSPTILAGGQYVSLAMTMEAYVES